MAAPVTSLTRGEALRKLDRLASEHPVQANRVLSKLRAALNWAVAQVHGVGLSHDAPAGYQRPRRSGSTRGVSGCHLPEDDSRDVPPAHTAGSSSPTYRNLVALAAMVLLVLLGRVASAQDTEDPGLSMPPAAPTVVRLALQWRPQSQFAGYYMARERGFYRAAGLQVDLLHASAEHPSLQMLQDQIVDLATAFLADAIIAAVPAAAAPAADELVSGVAGESSASVAPDDSRHERLSPALGIVQVAQVVQRSNLMLVAWKDMGVHSIADLDGRRVSHWQGGFSAAFEAFFAAHGINPIRIPQYDSVGLFLKRGIAACSAMQYNEYHRIWQAGIDPTRLTVFLLREHGVDFPEDGLYGTAAWVGAQRDSARAIREATLAGWAYARDHPEETLDVVLAEAQKAGVAANRPHQRWGLARVVEAVFPPGEPPSRAGTLDPGAFTRTAQALRAAGLLARTPAFSGFAPFDAPAP